MLKMKVDPAVCMKTQETMTKCQAIKQILARKCTHGARIDSDRSAYWQKMRELRDKSGRSGSFRANPERLPRVGRWHSRLARDPHGQDGHAARTLKK